MKKIITWLVLSLLCTVAFALPRPSQIEDALVAKNYAEARAMVSEVLRERPDSSRAHLLNAYLLVHADRNRAAATTELQTAAGLDKRGDVKSSALFGRVVAEIDASPAARALAVLSPPGPAPAPRQDPNGFPWLIAMFVLSFGAVGLYMVLRRRALPAGAGRSSFASPMVHVAPMPQARPTPTPTPTAAAQRTNSFGAAYSTPSTPAAQSTTVVHEHHYAQAPAPQPMGAFGTAASVAGGVVAGNALSDLMRHGHDSGSRYDDFDARRRRDSLSSSYSDPSPERSSFSSSSSGSDSWSSSSSDSGSSSDWGSSSSFDSGSSSSFD